MPPEQYNRTYESIFDNLELLLQDGGYAFVRGEFFAPLAFLRAFFVNHSDERCVSRFLC
jgi:hypothetical protein